MQLWPSLIVVVHQEFDTLQVPICLWISSPQEIKLKMCGSEKATVVSTRVRTRFKSSLMFIRAPLGRVPALQLLKSSGFLSILLKLSHSSSVIWGINSYPFSTFTFSHLVSFFSTLNPPNWLSSPDSKPCTLYSTPWSTSEWQTELEPRNRNGWHEILGIAGWGMLEFDAPFNFFWNLLPW